MPNISWKNTPGSGTLAAGGSPTGVDISENWYYPSAAGDQSLEVINGHIDAANLDSSFKFNNRHLQKETMTKSGMVGCTANIDYFGKMFGGADTYNATGTFKENSDAFLSKDALSVPGLGIRFYNPNAGAKCVIQWNFSQQTDGTYKFGDTLQGTGKNFPAFFLFVDDVMDPTNARRYVPGAFNAEGTGPNYIYGRTWTGHKLIKNLSKGWHQASIKLVIPNANPDSGVGGSRFVTQCRVRSRGMRYILFR